jgi:hypothetical protein
LPPIASIPIRGGVCWWIKAKQAELKPKAVQANKNTPIIKNGYYVRFKKGISVEITNNEGEIVKCSTFRVIDKETGWYAGISADGVEQKEIVRLDPREALSVIEICSPFLEESQQSNAAS